MSGVAAVVRDDRFKRMRPAVRIFGAFSRRSQVTLQFFDTRLQLLDTRLLGALGIASALRCALQRLIGTGNQSPLGGVQIPPPSVSEPVHATEPTQGAGQQVPHATLIVYQPCRLSVLPRAAPAVARLPAADNPRTAADRLEGAARNGQYV